MNGYGWTGRVAGFAARHPWQILGTWIVLLVAAFLVSGSLRTADEGGVQDTEARRARELVEQLTGEAKLTEDEFVVVEAEPTVGDAEFAAFVGTLVEDMRALEVVQGATSYLDGKPELRTADGRVALIPVNTTLTETDDIAPGLPLLDIVEEADAEPGYEVTSAGALSFRATFDEMADETFAKGEMIGLVAAIVIMLLVFRAVVASFVPILLGISAVFTAVGIVALISTAYEVNTFTVIVLTMVGLAVGIDYSLFIVQRFREERALGFAKVEAIQVAGSTASRAVLFSGCAVAIALAGMFIMPDPLFKSFAIGAIVVVVTAVTSALTLLPALLGLLGDRVNALSIPIIGRRGAVGRPGFWTKVTRFATAKPAVSVVLASALLVAATTPLLTMKLGSNGVGILPEDSSPRRAFTTVNERFTDGVLTAEIVVVDEGLAPGELEAGIAEFSGLVATDNFFGEPEVETREADGLTRISVAMKGDFSSDESFAAIERLREDYLPASFAPERTEVLVGGETAEVVDAVAIVKEYVPIIIGLVLTASFVLLLVAFRSIVVPLKAVVMNLLSVGAAYGLIVLVFQRGLGNELFGFPQTDVIESWIPLFLFAILFGMSMDYHVFLLSRIKEQYDRTADNRESVVHGLNATAAIITGAAAIMVAVFGGFALGPLSMFQQMGFGLAVAIILDATVVRMILVPASMELLGDRNWYFPPWLEWIPRINIEGHASPVPADFRREEPRFETAAALD